MGWEDDSAELLRQLAPGDLAGQQLYVVDARQVEQYDSRLGLPGAAGWTGRCADLQLADFLTRAGRWQGRGFACAVYPDRCRDVQHLVGCAAHELAHFVCYPQPQETGQAADVLARELLGWLDTPGTATTQQAAAELPRWHQHGADFVRAAAHLSHRAGLLMQSVRPAHLQYSKPYLGSAFAERMWVDALAGELDTRQPLRELIKTPAPQRFVELWELATSWW